MVYWRGEPSRRLRAYLGQNDACKVLSCQICYELKARQAGSMCTYIHSWKVIVQPLRKILAMLWIGSISMCHKYSSPYRTDAKQFPKAWHHKRWGATSTLPVVDANSVEQSNPPRDVSTMVWRSRCISCWAYSQPRPFVPPVTMEVKLC